MLQRILSQEIEGLLAGERHWLNKLQVTLARFGATDEDRGALERSVRQLDELFLLVVVGEFNAGKSAFINALLGQTVLEEGVTPTTTRIHLLKYGNELEHTAIEAGVDIMTAPVPLLQEINIVDTPGTNAIHREHEAITQEFVPRSDLVLFVTSADRPFTESERLFLERIRDWGKKTVIVLNKIDILQDSQAIEQIQVFIAENARKLLGFAPEIFAVSAKQAQKAKETGADELLTRSGFEALEDYIVDTLDEKERIRLKLHNPLGVGLHLIKKYKGVVNSRLELLKEDLMTIEDIERQIALYREDMIHDFHYRIADVENVLHEFENRGMLYFDETMRLGRIVDLLNRSKLQEEFANEIVGDVPQIIEKRTTEVIDWLVSSNLRQWQGVMERVSERRNIHAERIVGYVGGNFDYDRDKLLATVGRAAQDTLESYDRETESFRMAESLQRAVASTALVEVSAIGLGAVITTIATTTAADMTGILAAGTLAVLGLFVIPARRRQVKEELHEKISGMREQLMAALNEQFERELENNLHNINTAIAPYTRFIRSERDYLKNMEQELVNIAKWLQSIEGEVNGL
ncbi:MAG: dynamin family protein [Anaerolineae bacterium]|nr:dynamin family protein [Anaerolineae bacterium]